MKPTSNYPTTQRGGALITALSILLILTVLGVSSMSTTALQERMAGNARDHEVAFEAAEFALRSAEVYVNTLTGTTMAADFSAAGGPTGGRFSKRGPTNHFDAWTVSGNWGTAVTVPFGMSVATQPQYIIQEVESNLGAGGEIVELTAGVVVPKPKVFLITSRGFGLSATSRVMLQTYYVQYFN